MLAHTSEEEVDVAVSSITKRKSCLNDFPVSQGPHDTATPLVVLEQLSLRPDTPVDIVLVRGEDKNLSLRTMTRKNTKELLLED